MSKYKNSITELRQAGKKLGIRGYSILTRRDLVKAITKAHEEAKRA